DLPAALQDRGGWANRDCARWFADYAAVMYDRLSDRVARWLTIESWRNRWTLGRLQLRYGRDGRWYPFTERDGGWWPAGPPERDPSAAVHERWQPDR
ncbi:glycosyl hydrolase family protein, partial [Nonomuraea sp. KC401]|uniref:family 1 glycosylhydrolase n=1 Tax=Nonomuraea sp. KC401 TaxID=1848324 RepID=UPI0010FD2D53